MRRICAVVCFVLALAMPVCAGAESFHAQGPGKIVSAICEIIFSSTPTDGSIIGKNKPMRMAITVKSKMPGNTENECHEHLNHENESYLSMFGEYENFTLVERENLEEILGEHRLSYTGVLDKTVEAGRILGLTHILRIEFIPGINGGRIETGSLIEVETGKIVSSYSFHWQ